LTQRFGGIFGGTKRSHERKDIMVIIIIINNDLEVFHHLDTLHLNHHPHPKQRPLRVHHLVFARLVALGRRLVLHFRAFGRIWLLDIVLLISDKRICIQLLSGY
jgi:hypothetical protein